MCDEIREYTVIPYNGIQAVDREVRVQISCATPEEAARLVLDEQLIRFGRVKDLRAKVLIDGLHGEVHTVLLYRIAVLRGTPRC